MIDLPARKQGQIRAIVRLIRSMADVERIVLFGSHARGDWVEDRANGYISDLDILVLVSRPELAADDALWADCEDRARDIGGDTPISLIVHSIEDVNQRLARGNPFFREIISEGVALYDAGRIAPPKVTALTLAQRHALAEMACAHYFEHAAQLYESFEQTLADTHYSIAAFNLHATAEMLYKAIILVFAGDLPKTHDLAALDRMTARVAPVIGSLIPETEPERQRLAAVIRAAYVDARYNMAFKVAKDELETIGRFVRAMHERAEHACKERLAALAAELESARR